MSKGKGNTNGEPEPRRLCYVCGDEIPGNCMTHSYDAPGTERWTEWYRATGRKTDIGEILLKHLTESEIGWEWLVKAHAAAKALAEEVGAPE